MSNGHHPPPALEAAVPRAFHLVHPRRRRRTAAAALGALCLTLLAMLAFTASAHAGTTTASTLVKTGTDKTTGATVTDTESTGTTGPGDTINWVMNYANSTGSSASVNLTDPIGANQTYVAGSLQVPPSLSSQYSSNGTSGWTVGTPPASSGGVGGVGTVPAGTTDAVSPPFSLSTVTFNTPGGDGYTVEGSGGNIYTVFHHTGGAHNPTTAVFCATLANAVCEGWPGYSTYVNPAAGTPIGTGGPGTYTTASENGSFIVGGKLYWPVESTVASGGTYSLGIQCLNLTTQQSCGFAPLSSTTYPPIQEQFGMISTDGIAASDGNYYALVPSGELICFNPGTFASCGSTAVTGGVVAGWEGKGNLGNVMTDGPHIFVSYADAAANAYMSCYDVETHALCGPGFPKLLGASKEPGLAPFLAPVLSPTGALEGACGIGTLQCYSLTGTPLPVDPYGATEKMGLQDQNGFGSGLIRGTKFYAGDGTQPVHVQCYDFSKWTGTGEVPKCAGFSPPPDESNYTVRALANLPGCLAADGDAGVINIFNAETGAPCTTGTQKVTLTPGEYYCDGQTGHASSWGAVSLTGLAGGEYAGATVTLYGADGKALPAWTNVPIPAGSTSLDISSIPVSGNTAKLTAEVNIAGVTDPTAVEHSRVEESWRGDAIQVCFKTKVGPQKCSVAQSIPNEGTVVTTGANGVSDAPGGDRSGRATFLMEPNPELNGCEADLKIEKLAGSTKVASGGQVMYTLVVKNRGPDTATNATVSDAIPSGLSVSSAQPSQGSCSVAGSVDCMLGTIVNGGSAQILVTAKVAADAPATIKNCANVSAKQVDPDNSNNADCAEITHTTEALAQPFDLVVVKKADQKTAVVGQDVTYTITVTNNGPAVAPNATLNDTATEPFTVVSAKPSTGKCDTTIPLHCSLGTIQVGGKVTIKVVAQPKKSGKNQTNTASATAEGTDANPNNNVDAAKIGTKKIHLLLKKVADKTEVAVGGLVHYTIRVTNPTAGTAHQVETCDTMPSGLAYVSSSPKAKFVKGVVCWKRKALGAHQTVSYRVTARALRAGRTLVNRATTKTPDMKKALHAKWAVHVHAAKAKPTPVTG